MRREEGVTVQGPVKKQPPDGMSHGGGGGMKHIAVWMFTDTSPATRRHRIYGPKQPPAELHLRGAFRCQYPHGTSTSAEGCRGSFHRPKGCGGSCTGVSTRWSGGVILVLWVMEAVLGGLGLARRHPQRQGRAYCGRAGGARAGIPRHTTKAPNAMHVAPKWC